MNQLLLTPFCERETTRDNGKETSLSPLPPRERKKRVNMGGTTPLSTSSFSSSRPFSREETAQFGLQIIKQLPKGYQFTLKGLFPNVRVRGDPRNRNMLIFLARREGLLRCAGYTDRDQESRNGGAAALWEVV